MKSKTVMLATVILVISLFIGLVGCAAEAPAPAPTPAPTPTPAPSPTPTPAAPPAPKYEWVAQGHWASGHLHDVLVRKQIQMIEDRSGGQIEIEYHYAGEIVPAYEVWDATGKGIIDAGFSCPCYSAIKVPATAVFCAAPAHLSIIAKMLWELEGGGLELQQEVFRDIYGFQYLPGLPLISEVFAYSRLPMESVAELQKVKMRSAGTRAKIFDEAGVSVVSIPGPEIVPSMEKGVIDACEYADAWGDGGQGFFEVSDYVYLTKNPMGALMSFMVNGDKWAELSPELQEAVTSASIDARQWGVAHLMMYNLQTWRDIEEKGLVDVRLLPDEVSQHMADAAKSYYEKARVEDELLDRILISMEKFEAKYADLEPLAASQAFNLWGKY